MGWWDSGDTAAGCRLSAYRFLLAGIPERKRVQAPSAPGFYHSCASRRTMGSARERLRLPGWFKGSYVVSLPLARYGALGRQDISRLRRL